MHAPLLISALALALGLGLALSVAHSDEPPAAPPPLSQEEMMKRWEEAIRPGPHHRDLAYFVGTWDVAVKMVMPGLEMPAEKGEAVGAWLIEGRWMSLRMKGTMMGKPYEGFGTFGFDNTKKKHVSSWVDTSGTALNHSEGVIVDPTGKTVVQYGTLDEFLTGEHDKPVRYTTKRLSADSFTFEIWDLGIGEEGAIVVRQTYTRRK